jgi:hypothetical protein
MAGFQALLRSQRFALLAGHFLQRAERLGCGLARRRPAQRTAEGVLRFRPDTSALLAERGIRITVTTMAASIAPWPVLLACLRASRLTQAPVSWQASLTAFAMVRLLTVLPVTPGGLGIVELGLTAPLAAGLGHAAAARVAAAVLLSRAVTYPPSVPLGALAYLWWRHRVRSQRPCTPGVPATTSANRCGHAGAGRGSRFGSAGFATPSPDHRGRTPKRESYGGRMRDELLAIKQSDTLLGPSSSSLTGHQCCLGKLIELYWVDSACREQHIPDRRCGADHHGYAGLRHICVWPEGP